MKAVPDAKISHNEKGKRVDLPSGFSFQFVGANDGGEIKAKFFSITPPISQKEYNKMDSYEHEQFKAWMERYGDDDDEPLVSWKNFKKNYWRCSRCGGWDDTYCICYAR